MADESNAEPADLPALIAHEEERLYRSLSIPRSLVMADAPAMNGYGVSLAMRHWAQVLRHRPWAFPPADPEFNEILRTYRIPDEDFGWWVLRDHLQELGREDLVDALDRNVFDVQATYCWLSDFWVLTKASGYKPPRRPTYAGSFEGEYVVVRGGVPKPGD